LDAVPEGYAYAFDVRHRDNRTVTHVILPHQSCLARFVNAPPPGRRSNCAFEQTFADGSRRGRIFLRALVDIAPDSELLASYGRDTRALVAQGRPVP
jgi:hypothetical protein